MCRHHRLRPIIAAVLAACFVAACSSQPTAPAAPPDTRVADEAAIRAADADFAKEVAAKDLERCMSYYADDAILISPGNPALVGKDNIRKFIERLIAVPNLQLNITVSSVDVARSGDLALDRGSVAATVTGKHGKSSTQTSLYALTWKKDADGSWKIAADTSGNEMGPIKRSKPTTHSKKTRHR
jgi:uncharacterized protein (TIGR02246 family)